MKVQELIEQLRELPPELPVYVWVDGERLKLTMVDDSFVDDAGGFVELNAEPEAGFSWPSIYIVTNEDGSELGTFDTLKEAIAASDLYQKQTGSAAYIDQDLKAPSFQEITK